MSRYYWYAALLVSLAMVIGTASLFWEYGDRTDLAGFAVFFIVGGVSSVQISRQMDDKEALSA